MPTIETAGEEPASVRHPNEALGESTTVIQVGEAIDAASQQSPEENRAELEKLSGQLNRISDRQSLDDMTGRLQGWLGTSQRAERPADEQVPGAFDFSTAQLHDVRLEKTPEGDVRYISVLVDAAGRKFESVMDSVAGESAYKTFQTLKSNPLAEMVYRRVAMSMLDNIIKAGQAAQQAAPVDAPRSAPATEDAEPVSN